MTLCQGHWTHWKRINPSSLKASEPKCWANMRDALLDFIADFSNHSAAISPAFLKTAQALTAAAHEALGNIPGTRPLVVDPFAGGGSIPLEALRIGADAFASDLNPVAVLLNKLVLEYIPRYGQRLANEVRKWGMWMKERAEQEIGDIYPQDSDGAIPIAYLWARTVTCEGPSCGAEIPLIVSMWLAKSKNGDTIALKLIPNFQEKHVDFVIVPNAKASNIKNGTVRGGSAKCPICEHPLPVASVRQQLRTQQGGADNARLFSVVTVYENKKGRFYRLPNNQDRLFFQKAIQKLEQIKERKGYFLPDEYLPPPGTLGFRVQRYGIEKWRDIFAPRQQLVLMTLLDLMQELDNKLSGEYEKAFSLAILSVLACAIDREAEHLSSLCRWNANGPKMQATFGHQTLRMLWDYCEANLFGGSVGSWENILECVISPFDAIVDVKGNGNAEKCSATHHLLSNDAASVFFTDPPYYDAVPYADLSDFFYVWLKRTIGDKYPELFDNVLTPKTDECVVDETKGHDKAYFERMMGQAMAEGCRILAPNGICTVVFAHKSTAGWEAQLQSMIDAGWIITGSWPIDTEMGTRLRAMDSAALASSIHLVCRPRKNPDGSLRTNDIGDWREVLYELPKRIHEWMPRLAKDGVVGADAIFSCLGPALEIFSRYTAVERADGQQVTLREYLEYVWGAVSQEALAMIFQGADTSGFEPDARLTAMWLWTLSTNENGKEKNNSNNSQQSWEPGDVGDEEEQESQPKQVVGGYALEFDAARKIAQGLGAELGKLTTLVEVKGNTARLRSVTERGRFLFEKDAGEPVVAKPRKRERARQLSLFSLQELEAEIESSGDIPTFSTGRTTLDRLHQAMLLFAAGRSEALRRFLREDGVGTDQRFWRLAIALNSLYPKGSEERRWVEHVQGLKKNLGL